MKGFCVVVVVVVFDFQMTCTVIYSYNKTN